MRPLLAVLIVVAAAWAAEVIVFDGRYSRAIWQEAVYQGHQFGADVKRWLDRSISGWRR
jgi:hypothetical protein